MAKRIFPVNIASSTCSTLFNIYITLKEGGVAGLLQYFPEVEPKGPFEVSFWFRGFEGFVQSQSAADLIGRRLFAF